ncbi:hypothetical protein QOT17_016492 [Balamuthia mandrillaris]
MYPGVDGNRSDRRPSGESVSMEPLAIPRRFPQFYSSNSCMRLHIKGALDYDPMITMPAQGGVFTLVAFLVLSFCFANAYTSTACQREQRITFRYLVDGPLRPPSANEPNEAVNGSQEEVLCFDGLIQDADHPLSSLGTLTGCARINSAHSVSYSELSAFQATVRHIIRLDGRGTIVDDDEASILPLINPLSDEFTHGVTAFTEEPNIVEEDGTKEFQGKEGVVQVMGRMNLADFPNSLIFEAIFDITIF